jgi:hypothetical protein
VADVGLARLEALRMGRPAVLHLQPLGYSIVVN